MSQATPKLEDILSKPLVQTGDDIPDGSYPGVLMGFSQPFWMPIAAQFRKEGGPEKKLQFEASYALRLKNGKVAEVTQLLPVPEGGMTNRRSNVYKALKAVGGSNRELMNEEGGFVTGVTLAKFIGSTATVSVKANAKGFPNVDAVTPPIEGLKFPTPEEVKAIAPSDGDVPF